VDVSRNDTLSPSSTHTISKALSPAVSRASASERQAPSPTHTARSSVSTIAGTHKPASGTTAAANRKIADLETTIRLLESKRLSDRERLKQLEHVQGERDKFEGIIQKLQAKYQGQNQEMAEMRKQLAEMEKRFESVEAMQEEHDFALENAALDREMAEELAESYKAELEGLKARAEELELEVEVLREENAELGGEMSAEEKASHGWLAMERNNERLREALLRLRDITQETEEELREQVRGLEEEVREFGGLKEELEVVREKLEKSEALVEDLRQQLDNALGAEDMIEDLTEKNMSQAEEIEELRATIEDLEALKELNDELEINHLETEKEMQEEIDFKETIISEQRRYTIQQQEKLEDMEYALSRFRELVTSLQSDLDDMRASNSVTEAQSEQLNEKQRAMMDLNLKLQVSAAKTQVKTIELERRRLDAEQASDHLAIVQLYLPEAYTADKDSVMALLRFKRVGAKANLLHGFVKERVSGHHHAGREDDLFAALDMLDKLVWVSAMCSKFVNAISHCSVDRFSRFSGALYELEPVERALNNWIDGLRKDELKERVCAEELQRSVALMEHLAGIHIHVLDDLEAYADDVHMRAVVMQSQLESTATALGAARALVQAKVTVGEYDELAAAFEKRAEAVINHARSAKVVVGKAVRGLEDLKSRSLSLTHDTADAFHECEAAVAELDLFTRRAGEELYALLSEETRTEPFTHDDVRDAIARVTQAVFNQSESDPFTVFASKLHLVTDRVADLAATATDLDLTAEFERRPAPWIVRAEELKKSKTVPVDLEEEMRRVRESRDEALRVVARKDQLLEEQEVKVELLEARMRDAAKKSDRLSELEKQISEAKRLEQTLQSQLLRQVDEMVGVKREAEHWKTLAEERAHNVPVDEGKARAGEKAVATAKEMSVLQAKIGILEGAVRYLREDAMRVRLSYAQPSSLSWLSEPLVRPKPAPVVQRELLAREGNDVLKGLLELAGRAEVVALKKPGEKRGWRPRSEKPAWKVARQKEDWEALSEWEGDVVRRGRDMQWGLPVSFEAGPGFGGEKQGMHGGHVRIVGVDQEVEAV
jgi:dynactin 1